MIQQFNCGKGIDSVVQLSLVRTVHDYDGKLLHRKHFHVQTDCTYTDVALS
jgi:hypothetical protein